VAGVTSVLAGGGGFGLAGGAGWLLIVTLPLFPGDSISSAPHPARAATIAAVLIHFTDFIFISWRLVFLRTPSFLRDDCSIVSGAPSHTVHNSLVGQ
jgi:hypothetical protein